MNTNNDLKQEKGAALKTGVPSKPKTHVLNSVQDFTLENDPEHLFLEMLDETKIDKVLVHGGSSKKASSSKNPPSPKKKPASQSYNIDKVGDLMKELKKKQRDISRSQKRLPFDADPQMFGMPSMPVKIDISDETKKCLADLTDAIKNIEIKHDVSSESLDSFKKMASDLGHGKKEIDVIFPGGEFSWITKFFDSGVPSVIVLGITCVLISKYCPEKGYQRTIFASLIVLLCVKHLGPTIVDKVSSFFGTSKEEDTTPHFFEMKDYAKLAASLFNIFLCANSGKKLFNATHFSDIMGKIAKNGSGVNALVDSVTIVMKAVREIIESFFNIGQDDTFVLTGHAFIDEFITEATNILNEDERHKLQLLQTSVDRVNKCIKLGESVAIKIPGHPDWIGIRNAIYNTLTKLNQVKTKLLNSNYMYSGIRMEPTAVFLRGPPGCGKSMSMQHLANALAAYTYEDDEFAEYEQQSSTSIHNRQAEVKYWDGYTSKMKILFFDDLGQQKDVKGEPDNEIFSVIRAINCFEMMLRIAALEGKGNTMMRCDFVIANSNLTTYNFESIVDINAFLRRWDIVVDVCPKPEFCVNPSAIPWRKKMDYSKLPIVDGVTRLHPDQLEFHVMKRTDVVSSDNTTSSQGNSTPGFEDTGVMIYWDELVSRVRARWQTKKKWHSLYVKDLNQTLHHYRAIHKQEVLVDKELIVDDKKEEIVPNMNSSSSKGKEPVRENYEEIVKTLLTSERSVMDSDYVKMSSLDSDSDENDESQSPTLLDYENYFQFVQTGKNFNLVVKSLRKKAKQARELTLLRQKNEEIKKKIFIKENIQNLPGFKPDDITKPFFFSEYDVRAMIAPGGVLQGLVEAIPLTNSFAVQYYKWQDKYGEETAYKAKSIFIYVYIVCLQQYAIAFGIEHLLPVFDEAVMKAIQESKRDEQIEVASNIIAKVFVDSDNPDVETSYDRFIKRSREKYDIVRKARVLPPWKYAIFNAYVWCSSWVKCTIEDLEDIFDQHIEPSRKIMHGLCIGYRIAVIYYSTRLLMYAINSLWGPGALSFGRTKVIEAPKNDEAIPLVETSGKETLRISRVIDLTSIKPASIQASSNQLYEVVKSITRRNTFQWWAPMRLPTRTSEKSHEMSGFAVGVVSNYLMVPYHFMSYLVTGLSGENRGKWFLDTDVVQIVSSRSPGIQYNCPIIDLVKVLSKANLTDLSNMMDTIIIEFPGMQPVRDIRKFFATREQIARYTTIDAVIVVPPNSEEIMEVHSVKAIQENIVRFESTRSNQVLRVGDFTQPDKIDKDKQHFEGYLVRNHWDYYNSHLGLGDCGTLLYVDDKTVPSCIVGMHVAGVESRSFGASTVLTREWIDELMKNFAAPIGDFDQIGLEISETDKTRPNMDTVGVLTPAQGSYIANRSRIIRSPIWNKYKKPLTAPAHLTKFVNKAGEELDPLEIALRKCCKPIKHIPAVALEAAIRSLEDNLRSSSKKAVSRIVYNFRQAVIGDGSDHFGPIDRNTSAGYPYIRQKGLRSKQRFFGKDPEYNLANEECWKLENECALIIEKAKNGIRCVHVYVDQLKDERRSESKNEEGNTRLYSASPTPLLIVTRQYFGAFAKWIASNAIFNGCAIGINPYSADWDLIAKRIEKFGKNKKNIGAGDFSNFDMSLNPEIIKAIVEMINRWYNDGEENAKVRRILSMEVYNSLHLVGRYLYYWFSGLASGGALTSLMDTLYNHVAFRLVWYYIFEECTLFNELVSLICGGDDNLFSDHDKIAHVFTEKNIQPVFELIGMKYGPEDKTKKIFDDDLRSLDQVTFNKRRFVFDESRRLYVGPLDLDTILEIPQWYRQSACGVGDLQVNVDVAVNELSIHDSKTYDRWVPAIMKACENVLGFTFPQNLEYEFRRNEVLTRGRAPWMESLIRYTASFSEEETEDSQPTVIHPASWLPTDLTEYRDGNVSARLDVGRTRSIQTYCQGAVKAALSNPRSLGLHVSLAREHAGISASAMNTNSNEPQENRPLGLEGSGVMAQTRDADSSDMFQNSSTTKGVNDAETIIASMTSMVSLSRTLVGSPLTGVDQEISGFLAKPQLLSTGAFQTTDTVPSNIWSAVVPSGIIQATPMWSNKLAGNLAFRGTLVLSLQINGNRFQQGRYILAWIPDGGASYNSPSANTRLFGLSANLTQTTQLPHVEIDVNCDTLAVLEIPFVNCVGYAVQSAASTITGLQNGYAYIRPYSPLVAPSGSTQCNYALYGHWKDIDFHMPVIPQMNSTSSRGVNMRVNRRLTPEAAEQDSVGIGPISSSLAKVRTTAQIFEGVPLLSSIAGPVAWASDVLGKAAGVWGWSKPIDESPHQKMTRTIFPRMNNADTADASHNLAVYEKSRLQELPGFAGSDIDEMSIPFLATIPAWISTFTWPESATEGTLLYSAYVNPHTFVVTSTYGTNTVTFPTPLAWVSNFFSQWRGGVKFTFKFVKTEFHSGRVLVCFLPIDTVYNSPVTGITVANSPYLHRTIIDIREGNEFSVTVPYISLTPYRRLFGPNNIGSTGIFQMFVLNPLVAPSTVSSSVTVLTEVSGGTDIEFAYPRDVREQPVLVATPQSGRANVCRLIDSGIGNAKTNSSLQFSSTSIGERILSLRTLIKRFNGVSWSVTTAPGGSNLAFFPFAIEISYINSSNVLSTPITSPADIYAQICFPFAIARGGVRWKLVETNPTLNSTWTIKSYPFSSSTVSGISNFYWVQNTQLYNPGGANFTTSYQNINGGTEVQFLPYQLSWSYPISDVLNNASAFTSLNYVYNSMAPPVGAQLVATVESTAQPLMYRAASEDFSLGMFCSIPGYTSWNLTNA